MASTRSRMTTILTLSVIAVVAMVGAARAATYTVTITDDSGAGSLRQAITNANANPDTDTIEFDIPGGGPHTIAPLSPLPIITDPVVIDGYTQTGASANTQAVGSDAVLKIALDGTGAGGGAVGVYITAGNSTVKGLVIQNFGMGGVYLATNGGNTVEGCFIGTDVNGTADQGNGDPGVTIDDVADNTIGGTTPTARNVISGNDDDGIHISGPNATGNLVQGNYIGTDVNGTADLGNSGDGVFIYDVPNNTVGGTVSEARNIISGNDGHGVYIYDTNATGNLVQGNYIGTDVNGTAALGNSSEGVYIEDAPDNTVGGTVAGARNIISGNPGGGILLDGADCTGNLVQGNYIGTDVNGTADLGIGGEGVAIEDAPNNTIGGTVSSARNVISGNGDAGILLDGAGCTGNLIQGNYIGTDVNGTAALGNTQYGVGIESSASDNTIGGTADGAGNTIAYNGREGIEVDGTGNALLGNAIFSNTDLGIDLAYDGVTANDADDPDTGPNNRQNFPILTDAKPSTSTVIDGTLNSIASTTFRVEFFSNDACDGSNYGEGQTYLGFLDVITDAGGDATFTATLAPTVSAGEFITATATDPSNNTSEFCECIAVNALVTPVLAVFGGVTIDDITPFLDWDDVAGASTYTVEYANNSDFTGSTEVSGIGQSQYTIPTTLVGGTYYWRVQAEGSGTASGYSASDSFVIIPTFTEWVVILLATAMMGYVVWHFRHPRATAS